MQLAGLLRNDRRVGLVAALTLAVGLLAGSLGCGGAGNNETVILPPGGGIGIGEIICTITSSIPGDTVVQGEIVTVTFRLTDANVRAIGEFLPVSFEVLGGHIPNPPDVTDENGEATVTFVTDPTYYGHGFVRLIQPDFDLRCDITFRIMQPACTLTAEIEDSMGMTVATGCGGSVMMARDEDHTVTWTVTREDVTTGTDEPLAGAMLLVRSSGQVPMEFTIGPTDAMGQVSQTVGIGGDVEPHPEQVGELTLTAEVIIPDVNMDGLEDALPCNSCTSVFDISDPPCDQNGGTVAVTYPFMNVLRPGEMATVDLTIERNMVPLANEDLWVEASNGSLNGSAQPILVTTDAAGFVSVVYQPFTGFGGSVMSPETDTLTFSAASASLVCEVTAEVNVATCGLEFAFAPAAEQGVVSSVDVTVTNVDVGTTNGRMVSLDATGGILSPPANVTGPLAGATITINYTPGNTVLEGSISLSFIDGYPCNTTTEFFPVMP